MKLNIQLIGLKEILQLFFIWLVLKDRGEYLPRSAGAALLVDKVGKYLLSLAALKADVSAVGREHVKVAEALYTQKRVAFWRDRKAQILQFRLDFLGGYGLHNVAGRFHVHRVSLVIGKAGDKDDIHFGVDFL